MPLTTLVSPTGRMMISYENRQWWCYYVCMLSPPAPPTAPFVSKLQASNHLLISPPLVLKALDAGVLVGPVVNGAPKVDGASLTAALAKPTITVAIGDAVFHVQPLALDLGHGSVRSHSGWHAQDSMNLTKRMRRRAWTGCWNLGKAAPELLGGNVAAAVSGFIVDEAVVVDYEYCPVDGYVNLIVTDVTPDAAKYLDRRIPIARGPLWTRP